MRCLPRPRSRGRSSIFRCPYQTSTWSRYDRASTRVPIKRLFTEYAFRSTWIKLPESTFTCSRLADSIRRAGSSRITAISSANRTRRPALRCANRSLRNCAYSAWLPHRVLPSFAEALQALRIADCPRLPVRVRQHEVIHQMLERLTSECDPQLGHVGEVR